MRDTDEFAKVRQKARRWGDDNVARLREPKCDGPSHCCLPLRHHGDRDQKRLTWRPRPQRLFARIFIGEARSVGSAATQLNDDDLLKPAITSLLSMGAREQSQDRDLRAAAKAAHQLVKLCAEYAVSQWEVPPTRRSHTIPTITAISVLSQL